MVAQRPINRAQLRSSLLSWYIRTYVCVYIRMCVRVCTYVCTFVCTYAAHLWEPHVDMLNVCLNQQFVILYAEAAFEDLGRILSLTWWSVKHSAWCYVHICMYVRTLLWIWGRLLVAVNTARLLHIRIYFYPINKPFHSLQYCNKLYVLHSTPGAYNSLSPLVPCPRINYEKSRHTWHGYNRSGRS